MSVCRDRRKYACRLLSEKLSLVMNNPVAVVADLSDQIERKLYEVCKDCLYSYSIRLWFVINQIEAQLLDKSTTKQPWTLQDWFTFLETF